jgi:ribosome recycling factor
MKEIFHEVEVHMQKALDHFHHELKQLRTGRASTAILDGVMVDYYGNPTPLRQVANLSVADHHMITAQPWDIKQINAIEKAIRAADLGLNPSNDGKMIRIPVPQLTEDRRRDLVKRAHDMAEHSRTGIRQARRDGLDKLKKMEKDKKITQDDERRGSEEIQKLHDRFIDQVTKGLVVKERDILEV